MINALKSSIEISIGQAINATSNFLSGVIQLSNQNSLVPDKYNQLLGAY